MTRSLLLSLSLILIVGCDKNSDSKSKEQEGTSTAPHINPGLTQGTQGPNQPGGTPGSQTPGSPGVSTAPQSGCFGFEGFITTDKYADLLNALPKDQRASLERTNPQTPKESAGALAELAIGLPENHVPAKHLLNCDKKMTLLAPFFHYTENAQGDEIACAGFRVNPDPNYWYCEPAPQFILANNAEICTKKQEFSKALACAPRDTSKLGIPIDTRPCQGNEVSDKAEKKKLEATITEKIRKHFPNTQIYCHGDSRPKCHNYESAEPFNKWVNCSTVADSCSGFKTPPTDPTLKCWLRLDVYPEVLKRCGERWDCGLKQ